MASVCIERPPFITPPLPGKVLLSEDTLISLIPADMESKTLAIMQQKELEQSMLNDHELRHKSVLLIVDCKYKHFSFIGEI